MNYELGSFISLAWLEISLFCQGQQTNCLKRLHLFSKLHLACPCANVYDGIIFRHVCGWASAVLEKQLRKYPATLCRFMPKSRANEPLKVVFEVSGKGSVYVVTTGPWPTPRMRRLMSTHNSATGRDRCNVHSSNIIVSGLLK